MAPAMVVIDGASRVPDEVYLTLCPMLHSGGGDLWTRIAVPATECARVRPQVLEEERLAMGDAWFRQEYLCEFVQADDAVFREEDVDACLRSDVPPLVLEGV
jgi:hypothetical protein